MIAIAAKETRTDEGGFRGRQTGRGRGNRCKIDHTMGA